MEGLDVTISSQGARSILDSVLAAAVDEVGGDWHGTSIEPGWTTYHFGGDSDALAGALAPVFSEVDVVLVRSYWPDGTVANETNELMVVA